MNDLRQRLEDLTGQAVRDAAVPAPSVVVAMGRRRRRRQVAGGVLVMVGLLALAALTVPALRSLQGHESAVTPVRPAPLPALPLEPNGPAGAGYGVVDVTVGVYGNATASQRRELERLLRTSPLVDELWFESAADAWVRYKAQFADEPRMLEGVSEEQMPESYLLRLTDPSRFEELEAVLCPPGPRDCLPAVDGVAEVYELRRRVLAGSYWPSRADVSVLLTLTVGDEQRQALQARIEDLPMVDSVEYESGARALERLPRDLRGPLESMQAPMPASLRVRLDDPGSAGAFHRALCRTLRTGDCADGVAVVYEHPRKR